MNDGAMNDRFMVLDLAVFLKRFPSCSVGQGYRAARQPVKPFVGKLIYFFERRGCYRISAIGDDWISLERAAR